MLIGSGKLKTFKSWQVYLGVRTPTDKNREKLGRGNFGQGKKPKGQIGVPKKHGQKEGTKTQKERGKTNFIWASGGNENISARKSKGAQGRGWGQRHKTGE